MVTPSPVRAIAEDERGELWFATDTGLIVFDGADWWQRQGAELVRLFTELTVRSPIERGVSELTFWRFVRNNNLWQSLTPNGAAQFITANPPAAATAEAAVRAMTWTDGVNPQLGSFDGDAFTASADAPAAIRVRFKPDALRILDGGSAPRLLLA